MMVMIMSCEVVGIESISICFGMVQLYVIFNSVFYSPFPISYLEHMFFGGNNEEEL